MTNVYLHDPKLGIIYQEETDLKLFLIKQKGNGLIFFGGTEAELTEFNEEHKDNILGIYAFSELLLDYMNIIGDRKVLPILNRDKYIHVGEQVL